MSVAPRIFELQISAHPQTSRIEELKNCQKWIYNLKTKKTEREQIHSHTHTTTSIQQQTSKMAILRSMKLKERLAVGLGISLVLITILLIADLQMDMHMSKGRFVPPMHAKIYNGNDSDRNGVFSAFRKKFQLP